MRCKQTVVVAALAMFAAGSALAQDEEKKLGWSLTAEVSYVATSGNSESGTFGLGATARRVWERALLRIDGGSIRTESSLKTRFATGTSQDDFVLTEQKNSEVTAENYFVRGKYDYLIGKAFTLFGGADWMRNRFTGIDSRFLIAGGAGNVWRSDDKIKFKTNYSVTYTFEEDVVENPFTKSNFPGARFAYDFWWSLTTTTELNSDFTLDWNLDNTDDVRIDFTNSLPVKITSKMALMPALQLLWRNDPALASVALFDSGGTPTGTTVLVPLEELDAIFTLSLVISL